MAGEVHPMPMTPQREREMRATGKAVISGSIAELAGGAAGVVLAILGLSGVLPPYTAPVAAMALGAAVLLQGCALGARLRRLLAEATEGSVGAVEFGGGVSVEFVGGCAALVLGILALGNVEPITLLGVASLVLGGTLVLGSGTASRLNALAVHQDAPGLVHELSREVVNASAGAQIMVGGAAIVLGILALVGNHPAELTLVAFLIVGSSVLLSGAAISGRLAMFFEATR
jgi:hypothetical protein